MKNVVVRSGVGALALTGMSIASAAVIAAVPAMSQAATVAATEGQRRRHSSPRTPQPSAHMR
ncbi:hypothetical protein [Gordonia sputi]